MTITPSTPLVSYRDAQALAWQYRARRALTESRRQPRRLGELLDEAARCRVIAVCIALSALGVHSVYPVISCSRGRGFEVGGWIAWTTVSGEPRPFAPFTFIVPPDGAISVWRDVDELTAVIPGTGPGCPVHETARRIHAYAEAHLTR